MVTAVPLELANSTELDPITPHPVICILQEQKDVTNKGASMRLGTWPTMLGDVASECFAVESEPVKR